MLSRQRRKKLMNQAVPSLGQNLHTELSTGIVQNFFACNMGFPACSRQRDRVHSASNQIEP